MLKSVEKYKCLAKNTEKKHHLKIDLKAEIIDGAGGMKMLVTNTDQVLPKLLGDGGALLGHGGLLVDGDDDGLHGLHDVDAAS